MNAQHSPGPFEIDGEGAVIASVPTSFRSVALITAPTVPVHDEPRGEVAVANAQLLKAAPQMLSALESALDWYEGTGFCACAPDPCECIVGSAREAIAAAKGGAR
jgi:hypothetical protein